MRCKCCDQTATVHITPDYYCDPCYDSILGQRGERFNFSDLYRIVVGDDDEGLVETYRQIGKDSGYD